MDVHVSLSFSKPSKYRRAGTAGGGPLARRLEVGG